MKILGFDSAGKTAGVAVWQDGTILYEANLRAGLTHSQTLLPLCRQALAQTNLSLDDVDLLALIWGREALQGFALGWLPRKGFAFRAGFPASGFARWSHWLTACR